jgi:hypothetical protein
MRRRFTAVQLELLPGTNTATSYRLKAPPKQDEEKLMRQLQEAAALLGLVTVHLQTFCNNHFYVTCPACKRPILAHCKAHPNAEYAGMPDILVVSAAVEVKRDRNQAGDPFEPTARQTAAHEALRRRGIPVMVVSPGNLQEAVQFLQRLSKERQA